MAEMVKHFFPKLVDLHNYSAAHSVSQKLYNWNTLNRASCHLFSSYFLSLTLSLSFPYSFHFHLILSNFCWLA